MKIAVLLCLLAALMPHHAAAQGVVAAAKPAAASAAAPAGDVCVLPLTLSPTQSVVAAAGAVTAPFAAKVNSQTKATLSGTVHVVFPGARACPTAATAATALATAYIAYLKGSPSIAATPATAVLMLESTPAATLTIANFTSILLSRPGPAGVATPNVTGVTGALVTQTQLMAIPPFNLAGRTVPMEGGCKLTAAADTVTYSCPKMSIRRDFNSTMGAGSMDLTGVLVAAGKLSGARLVPAATVPVPPPARR